jgi:hypothetical protein
MWSKMCIGLHVKCRLLLADFSETWILKTNFGKIRKYQIWWQSVQRQPNCPMRTDRQTGESKANSRSYENLPTPLNTVNIPQSTAVHTLRRQVPQTPDLNLTSLHLSRHTSFSTYHLVLRSHFPFSLLYMPFLWDMTPFVLDEGYGRLREPANPSWRYMNKSAANQNRTQR